MRLEVLEPRRLMAAGDLDVHFGEAGYFTPDIEVWRMATLDRLTVLLGRSDGYMAFRRLMPGGEYDEGFGKVVTAAPGDEIWSNLAIDPVDGRMAVAGLKHIRMFTADGKPDTSFGAEGIIPVRLRDHSDKTELSFQPDGSLLVRGDRAGSNGTWRYGAWRYGRDGVIESGFGQAGFVKLGRCTAVMKDGRFVSADFAFDDATGVTQLGVRRFTAEGKPDKSWGANGSVSASVRLSADENDRDHNLRMRIAIDADGRLVMEVDHHYVSTFYAPTPLDERRLMQFEKDGTPRWGFGKTVSLPWESYYLLIEPDGDVLSLRPEGDYRATRITRDGKVDRGYGKNGKVTIPSLSATANAIIQEDGKPVVAFWRYLETGVATTMVRLLSEPMAEASVTLAGNGTLHVSGSDSAEALSVNIRPSDGRVIARAGQVVKSFPPSQVKRVAVYAKAGNDSITIGAGVRGAYVDAWDGDDVIVAGDGDDLLIGGWGNDRITGGYGNDRILGGVGNDSMVGGAGNDALFGNGGVDLLSGAGGNDRLFGGAGADWVRGGNGRDLTEADVLDRREEDVEIVV